jgi:hypothetical protein
VSQTRLTMNFRFSTRPEIAAHFPAVTWVRGRGYVLRSALNQYKAELQAAALGVAPVAPQRVEPDPLVPLKQVSAELGVGRRTIGRRILEAQKATVAGDQAAA